MKAFKYNPAPMREWTVSELTDRIEWYNEVIAEWPTKYGRNAPTSFYDNREACRVARTAKIGKR